MSNPSRGTTNGATGASIAAVERDTGLGKDALRVWERRYGFPRPLRDSFGERVYPSEQVDQLRLIKRLMDQGHRPGKLLRKSSVELDELLASSHPEIGGANDAGEWLIPLLKSRAIDQLRTEFAQRLAREGLERFVIETVPELNRRIGHGWTTGEIEIYEEHLYTELTQNLLRTSIYALSNRSERPKVLLTTVKGEEHLLGLLMVESLLSANGACCHSLGGQTPIRDIVGAAVGTGTDIVALSFSGAYPWRKARDTLLELRAALPQDKEIWAGGAALAGVGRATEGICFIESLDAIAPALANWRVGRLAPS